MTLNPTHRILTNWNKGIKSYYRHMLNYSHTWLNENSKINMICPVITSQHGHLQQNMARQINMWIWLVVLGLVILKWVRVRLLLPRLFLYWESFSTENHVSSILQELSLTISQKKLVQENWMKLFSHQKAELGPLLPETPVTQASKSSKICSK